MLDKILSALGFSRQETSPELRAFLLGVLFLGITNGLLNSTFNNYLEEVFRLDAAQRGALELPREFPGFAVFFVTALLVALPMRAWGLLIGILSAVGVAGLGLMSPTVAAMTCWMVLWSLADHLFMPVESAMGLSLAKGGAEGRRLGQISGMRNLAMIGGSALVVLLMGRLPGGYSSIFVIGAVSSSLAAWAFWTVRLTGGSNIKPKRFVVRRRYQVYYALNILFGARKQVFLTFAPWVLVSVHGVTATTIASFLLVSAVLGVVFRQWFGIATDRLGERAMLVGDSLIFLGICLGFAFSTNVALLGGLYILDNLMFATRIARTTYLNRMLVEKSDLAPTLSFGVTIDHAVSMTIPFFGGLLWTGYGYGAVFLAAGVVAVMNAFVSMAIGARRAA
jgi:predicted MFS family arabinose efflux permease